ncbi:MAG: PAS domain S-box protein [Pseudomonadota bacterium]
MSIFRWPEEHTGQTSWSGTGEREHFAQFYDDESVLLESVAGFVQNGIETGAAIVLVVTEAHRATLGRRWRSLGLDTAALRERGQFVVLDAAQTLARIMDGDRPDRARLFELAHGFLAPMAGRHGRIAIFGEMVTLLWKAGRYEAAIELDGLWNELVAPYSLSLFCAFPLQDCASSAQQEHLRRLCASHTRIAPAEALTALTDVDERMRAVAYLQQQAASLEQALRAHRRIELTLGHREREFADLAENAPIPIHMVGPDGIIRWANAAELALLGCTADEYLGHHIGEFHADRRAADALLARILAGETLHEYPARLRRRDGAILDVLLSVNSHLENGKVVYSRCYTRDVTDRVRAEERLLERDAVLHLAMRSAHMGMWVHDLQNDAVRWSAELEELCGLPPGGFGDSFAAFRERVHPEDQQALASAIEDAIVDGRDYRVEFRFRHANGTWRWMEGRGRAVYDASGRAVRLCGIAMDVTERKRAEESQVLLAALVECSHDAIISKTLDGRISSWNAGAQRIFGYAPEEVIGRPITILIPPELQHEEDQILARVENGERIEHYETERLARDGRRISVSLTVSPIRDGRGNVVGASKIARDVTERKRAEAALREADRRKDEFLAILAHELRNPLAPIRYALTIARQPGRTAQQHRRTQDVIERQVEHMARLLDDLLDVSRITRGVMELRKTRMELTSAIAAAIEAARPALDARRHTLTVDLPREPVRLEADAVRLAQVFSNLLINAAKYTDAGGDIRLEAKPEGREVVVTVSDNGIGISPEMMPRLFTLFSQAHSALERSEGGLGIGLALVRGLVNLHGGTIEAHSEGLGRGSRFVVRLPLGTAPEEEPRKRRRKERTERRTSLRVLVADDNRDSAECCATLLQLWGHEVEIAHSGRQALEAAESFRPDAVVLDIGMPEMNGYEVAARIRAAEWGRETILIAVTGWGQDEDKRRAMEAGFDHHLTKPIDPRCLETLLRREGNEGPAPAAS